MTDGMLAAFSSLKANDPGTSTDGKAAYYEPDNTGLIANDRRAAARWKRFLLVDAAKVAAFLEHCVERFRDIVPSDRPKTFPFITDIGAAERPRFEHEFISLYSTIVTRTQRARIIGMTFAVTGAAPVSVELGGSELLHYNAKATSRASRHTIPKTMCKLHASIATLGPSRRSMRTP
jgi:hypothetical protein